jgi:hypothetical protein
VVEREGAEGARRERGCGRVSEYEGRDAENYNYH